MADPIVTAPAAAPVAAAAPAATPAAPAAAPATLADAAAASAAATPAPATPGAPPASYAPDGLPAELRGATDRETIDKLWKAQSEAPKPPAKSADYKLELPETMKGAIDEAKDPALPLFREVALKHGLSAKQFNGVIGDFYAAMKGAGLVNDPGEKQVFFAKEFEALGQGTPGDQKSRIAAGEKRVLAIVDTIKGLQTRGQISADEMGAVAEMITSRHAVTMLEKLAAFLPKEQGVTPGGQAGAVVDMTDPAVRARLMYPNSQARQSS